MSIFSIDPINEYHTKSNKSYLTELCSQLTRAKYVGKVFKNLEYLKNLKQLNPAQKIIKSCEDNYLRVDSNNERENIEYKQNQLNQLSRSYNRYKEILDAENILNNKSEFLEFLDTCNKLWLNLNINEPLDIKEIIFALEKFKENNIEVYYSKLPSYVKNTEEKLKRQKNNSLKKITSEILKAKFEINEFSRIDDYLNINAAFLEKEYIFKKLEDAWYILAIFQNKKEILKKSNSIEELLAIKKDLTNLPTKNLITENANSEINTLIKTIDKRINYINKIKEIKVTMEISEEVKELSYERAENFISYLELNYNNLDKKTKNHYTKLLLIKKAFENYEKISEFKQDKILKEIKTFIKQQKLHNQIEKYIKILKEKLKQIINETIKNIKSENIQNENHEELLKKYEEKINELEKIVEYKKNNEDYYILIEEVFEALILTIKEKKDEISFQKLNLLERLESKFSHQLLKQTSFNEKDAKQYWNQIYFSVFLENSKIDFNPTIIKEERNKLYLKIHPDKNRLIENTEYSQFVSNLYESLTQR